MATRHPSAASRLVAGSNAFAGVHSFFQSSLWHALVIGLFAVSVGVWIGAAFWVFRDARQRLNHRLHVATAVALALVPPFLGPLLYLLFRPPELLQDMRRRTLEIRLLERMGAFERRCPTCNGEIAAGFRVCPVCTTRLRNGCAGCGAALDTAWRACPYCAQSLLSDEALLAPAEHIAGEQP